MQRKDKSDLTVLPETITSNLVSSVRSAALSHEVVLFSKHFQNFLYVVGYIYVFIIMNISSPFRLNKCEK